MPLLAYSLLLQVCYYTDQNTIETWWWAILTKDNYLQYQPLCSFLLIRGVVFSEPSDAD